MKLRNNKYLSKILELIKNKITDIIPNIIEIKREYNIFNVIRILEEKKEINEKFIIKCIEIFEILIVLKFYQKIEKSDYFY